MFMYVWISTYISVYYIVFIFIVIHNMYILCIHSLYSIYNFKLILINTHFIGLGYWQEHKLNYFLQSDIE